MDGAWDTFGKKSLNGTFTVHQKKTFGKKKIQIPCRGKKVPFWQFFREGQDGCALLVQPSRIPQWI